MSISHMQHNFAMPCWLTAAVHPLSPPPSPSHLTGRLAMRSLGVAAVSIHSCSTSTLGFICNNMGHPCCCVHHVPRSDGATAGTWKAALVALPAKG